MTFKASICGSLLLAVFAVATPVAASNMGFMNDTPYVHFTKEDHAIFDEALQDVLNKGADGESRKWTNPASKAGGDLKVLKSFQRGQTTCRRLSIANKAKGRSASGQYNFCRQASGEWKLSE
jgi:surface antigen